jgi:hypothetical protein
MGGGNGKCLLLGQAAYKLSRRLPFAARLADVGGDAAEFDTQSAQYLSPIGRAGSENERRM